MSLQCTFLSYFHDGCFQRESVGSKTDVNGNVPQRCPNEFEHCNKLLQLSVYFAWFVLLVMAYVREFLRKYGFEKNKAAVELEKQKVICIFV